MVKMVKINKLLHIKKQLQLQVYLVVILSLSLLLGYKVAMAEIKQIIIGVDGLSCPFCILPLSKKLNKVKSFDEKVDISYKLGLAKAELRERSFLDLAEVKQAVKEAGFTVRDITITAIGTITSREGNLALKVHGSEQIFIIESEKLRQESHEGEKVIDEKLKNQIEHWKADKSLVSVIGEVHEHQGIPAGLIVEKISRIEG